MAQSHDSISETTGPETSRRRALRRYEILDTPSEEEFDRLTLLASEFFGVEVAYVSFFDSDRQWFKSTVGLHRQDIALKESICVYTLERGEQTVVEDATREDMLSDCPLVRENGLRFYAGTPLSTQDGEVIGTFCIMDCGPRQLSDREAERLEAFAEMAVDELELRRERLEHRKARRRLEAVFQDPNVLMGVLAPDGTLIEANATALEYVDKDREYVLGKPFWETEWWPDRMRPDIKNSIQQAAKGEYVKYEAEIFGPDGSPHSLEGIARPVFDDDEVVSVIVSARDVTQRRRSEERYRALAENFPDGAVGVFDHELRYSLAAGTAAGETLPPPDHVEGSRMPDIFPEETVRDLEPLFRAAIEKGESGRVEARFNDRDWIVWATPLRNKDGEIYAGLSFAQDVTERNRQERELRLYKQVVEQASDAILITEANPLDEPGPRIEYVNPAFEEMTGYTSEEILGETPRILQGPKTDREVLDALRDALKKGEAWKGETVNYRKDGTPYRLRWSIAPVRNSNGEIERWMSVQRDVTSERERERVLRRHRNLLEQAQRLAGAWEIDLRTDEVLWSEKVYEIHELPPDTDISIEDAVEFYAPEARAEIREAFERCIEDRVPYDLELPLITAEGNRRWVRTVGAPVAEEDGEVIKVAGAFQDITDRKEAEEQLRRAKEAAEEAARLKTVMLANMSHEVRTPLTSMVGFSGVLMNRVEGRPAKLARLIYKSGKRLERTIEAVLQLSKLEAGSYDIRRETVRIDVQAKNLVGEFQLQADEKEIHLQVKSADGPVEAHADEIAVRRIIGNLLDNAIKFTPKGGRVTVRASVVDKDSVTLEVEDTGIGIEKEAVPSIFETFKQESEGLTREYEGVGLGLAIVQKLVDTLGGSIDVVTEKGMGSRFTVRLPRAYSDESR